MFAAARLGKARARQPGCAAQMSVLREPRTQARCTSREQESNDDARGAVNHCQLRLARTALGSCRSPGGRITEKTSVAPPAGPAPAALAYDLKMRATRLNKLASATGPRLRPAGRGAARTVRAWRPAAAGGKAAAAAAGCNEACFLSSHAWRSRHWGSWVRWPARRRPRRRRSGGRKLRHYRRALRGHRAPATELRKLDDRNADCLEPVATTEPRLHMAIASTAACWRCGRRRSRTELEWCTGDRLQAALQAQAAAWRRHWAARSQKHALALS